MYQLSPAVLWPVNQPYKIFRPKKAHHIPLMERRGEEAKKIQHFLIFYTLILLKIVFL
jgi:hypothetical protein